MPQSAKAFKVHNDASAAGEHQLAGREWMIEAFGCQPELLKDLDLITDICQQAVVDLGLNVLGSPQTHRFPGPGGVTALYLLSESHLACHTYPEFELATFNLYCCREREPWNWSDVLRRKLSAETVEIRNFDRGSRRSSTRGADSMLTSSPAETLQ